MTIGRLFSDTFAGITPSSAPGFIAAQLLGALAGLALVVLLYPDVSQAAAAVVVPHPSDGHPADGSTRNHGDHNSPQAAQLLDPPRRPR